MGTPELKIDGVVASITLVRPERANRLEPDDLAAIADHIATVNAAPEVRVLRLQAEGKYFCSGYDINRMGQARNVNFEEVVNALEDARPVTVAVMQGSVYGGGTDFALACDFRIGVHGMEMFMPAARLGLHFYRRGLERYLTRLGLDNAKRLFLTAETARAERMLAMGFLTDLVEPDALGATADTLCTTVASMAPIAVTGMKKHLNRMARGALDATELLKDIARAASSEDLKEGARAWAEKRPPRFTGR
ncbi:MAG: enoyl-CoA hydratase-related protein [Burkholderiaceae bacterium]